MKLMGRVCWAARAILALGCVVATTAATAAPPSSYVPTTPAPPAMPVSPTMPAPTPARVNLLDVVRPEFREGVLKCIRQPTITTRAVGEDVVCTVAVYQWLYEHPDRVTLAWRRLGIPTVSITDVGGGKFAWTDENGSEVVWQTVGVFRDGRVWYATGKVKPHPAAPSVPIQATFIVTHPRKAEKDGVAVFAPSVQVYVHSDSKAAHLALRIIGPAAPRLAEEAAGQLLDFFGGMAVYVQKHPTRAETLLGPAKK